MKSSIALLVVLAISGIPATVDAQTFEVDYKVQQLNSGGGTVVSQFTQAIEYVAALTYPPGTSGTFASIIDIWPNAPIPPTLHLVHLNFSFDYAPAHAGHVFSGTSTLVMTLPTSIPDGTTLKLVLWSTPATGPTVYGQTLSAVSQANKVTYTIQNLTMPGGDLKMTLGE